MSELVKSMQHLGPLHPMEHVLIYLLAFGPFVLLGLTIWVSKRRNSDDVDAPDPGIGE